MVYNTKHIIVNYKKKMKVETEDLQLYSDAVFWSVIVTTEDKKDKSNKVNGIILSLHQWKKKLIFLKSPIFWILSGELQLIFLSIRIETGSNYFLLVPLTFLPNLLLITLWNFSQNESP